jgi:hypothetical protein
MLASLLHLGLAPAGALAMFQSTSSNTFLMSVWATTTQSLSSSTMITTLTGISYTILSVVLIGGVFGVFAQGGDFKELFMLMVKTAVCGLLITQWNTFFMTDITTSGVFAIASSIQKTDVFSALGTSLFQNLKNDFTTSTGIVASILSDGDLEIVQLLFTVLACICYAVAYGILSVVFSLWGMVLYAMGPLLIATIPSGYFGHMGKTYVKALVEWLSWPILFAIISELMLQLNLTTTSGTGSSSPLWQSSPLSGQSADLLIAISTIIFSFMLLGLPWMAHKILTGDFAGSMGGAIKQTMGAVMTAAAAGTGAVMGGTGMLGGAGGGGVPAPGGAAPSHGGGAAPGPGGATPPPPSPPGGSNTNPAAPGPGGATPPPPSPPSGSNTNPSAPSPGGATPPASTSSGGDDANSGTSDSGGATPPQSTQSGGTNSTASTPKGGGSTSPSSSPSGTGTGGSTGSAGTEVASGDSAAAAAPSGGGAAAAAAAPEGGAMAVAAAAPPPPPPPPDKGGSSSGTGPGHGPGNSGSSSGSGSGGGAGSGGGGGWSNKGALAGALKGAFGGFGGLANAASNNMLKPPPPSEEQQYEAAAQRHSMNEAVKNGLTYAEYKGGPSSDDDIYNASFGDKK